jgi:acyl-[acyl-carrier-protein] desaturase
VEQKLISKWEIDKISGLTDEAEKHVIIWWNVQRMARISERIVIPQETHLFKWVEPARL